MLPKVDKFADLRKRLIFWCWPWSSIVSVHIFQFGHRPRGTGQALPVPGWRHSWAVQHVLGRCALALYGLRARDHAVHLGLNHHAAHVGGLSHPRGLEERRRGWRRKITQYTRYGTVVLAIVQAIGISVALESQPGLVIDPSLMFRFTTVVSLVTGTMFLMWLGEQITERGLGNGISIIIFAGIVAGCPVPWPASLNWFARAP